MIVTTNDPLADPATIAAVDWASNDNIIGGPVQQWSPNVDYTGHKRVAFIGHGIGAGRLIPAKPAAADVLTAEGLVASLVRRGGAISPGTDLFLVSCFSSARRGRKSIIDDSLIEADSLVERITAALTTAQIHDVRVFGGIGTVYSDIFRDRIVTGPAVDSPHTALIRQINENAWARSGIGAIIDRGTLRVLNQALAQGWYKEHPNHGIESIFKKCENPPLGLDGKARDDLLISAHPPTLDAAAKSHRVYEIVVNKNADPQTVVTVDALRPILVQAIKRCNQIFFDDPAIQQLFKAGQFTVVRDFQTVPAAR